MNAVEIEEAVSALAELPFDAEAFPYAFLEAFGNKPTTLKRLQSGTSNQTDLPGGVLQRNNIHIKICRAGEVAATLNALRESPATAKQKAKFILATDGESFEAEDLAGGETVACAYRDFPDHFGFFLPLAGISTVKQIRENAFDIKATSRLNRLYLELIKDNPEWGKEARRHDMNHFMARLIFCFFAEDTDIFFGGSLFTDTVEQMSERDASNTHTVISEIFRAMATAIGERRSAGLPRWADAFPYVNGGLFSGSAEVPRFSKLSRSYLMHIGSLDWTKINPDIFGSMIQAVADDEERGALGMHYTSVPNILKVLNPLFLDDLREKLEEAGDNKRKLLNLRNRMARIRVFDPACGSGNFLVIAYKEMRAIEAEINRRRGEPHRRSDLPLTNYRGIELRDFSAEIARLALVIAQYQCDVLYLGQKEALAVFLPLEANNWITCGNALRLDWLSICPPTGTGVKLRSDDLFDTPLDQAEIDFQNEGGETYICGNPPYLGASLQSSEQKSDLRMIFGGKTPTWKILDYVAGWFMKAAEFGMHTQCIAAFVTTNSVNQGQQVAVLWPLIFATGNTIVFAHTSFKWANLASHNAGVTVSIVAISEKRERSKVVYFCSENGMTGSYKCENINPYLVEGANLHVSAKRTPEHGLHPMVRGNGATDDGNLFLTHYEVSKLCFEYPGAKKIIFPFTGSEECINGSQRYCIWLNNDKLPLAKKIPEIQMRIDKVEKFRKKSKKTSTVLGAKTPHLFQEIRQNGDEIVVVVPRHSSENRPYLPFAILPKGWIVGDSAFSFFNPPFYNLALIGSRIHLVWIATVCGKLKTDFRYSNTLGWNTFPVPTLTEQNKRDLTCCAEGILLAREAHFPATIADLYDPGAMPDDLRAAHERNDETLERIYIGRRFKNDTERLEKLFEMYTKMTGGAHG